MFVGQQGHVDVSPEHYVPTGAVYRHRQPASLLVQPELLRGFVREGHTFMALVTNGTTGDICFASRPEYFFRGSLVNGRLMQHRYDRTFVSACHLTGGWTETNHLFHFDIDSPFLVGGDCLAVQRQTPVALLSDALGVVVPWNAMFFGGFAEDSRAALDPERGYDRTTTFGSLKALWDSEWNKMARACQATLPNLTVGVIGVGTRGFHVPTDPARAAQSRADKG